MNKNSFSLQHWQYAKQMIKKPFLYIDRVFGRYALNQDKKSPKYLTGKKNEKR